MTFNELKGYYAITEKKRASSIHQYRPMTSSEYSPLQGSVRIAIRVFSDSPISPFIGHVHMMCVCKFCIINLASLMEQTSTIEVRCPINNHATFDVKRDRVLADVLQVVLV